MSYTVRKVPSVDPSTVIDVTETSDSSYHGSRVCLDDIIMMHTVYVTEVVETGELIVRWYKRTTNGSEHRPVYIKGKPIN